MVDQTNTFRSDLHLSALFRIDASVLFFCGSLEKGRDGVGDYIIKLVSQLQSLGIKTAILAYNDRYIQEPIVKWNIEGTANQTITLRLPANLSPAKKKRTSEDFIRKFRPTIISLQFVPYSFNDRGIPFGLSKVLMQLSREKVRWHIMFHEIWLADTSGWKQKVAKLVQRIIICNLVKVLKPDVVHCSTEITKQRLRNFQIESKLLPLFGNIEFKSEVNEALRNKIKIYPYRVLYFGAAPKKEYLEQIVAKLAPVSARLRDLLSIIVVGKDSLEKTSFLNTLRIQLSPQTGIFDTGFLEERSISFLMQFCTIGISRYSPELLGKSGTAIAMLEFGLPIWLPRASHSDSIEFHFRKELIFTDIEKAIKYKANESYYSLLPSTTSKFIEDLQD